MKFLIYINHPERFIDKDYFLAINICPESDADYFIVRENKTVLATVDIDVDQVDEREKAIQRISEKIKQIRFEREREIEELIERKQRLMALPVLT